MDRGRRIACVWLPRFALAVARGLDTHASLVRGPARASDRSLLALYRPGTRWQELLECSPELEAAGVRPGMALKEAQARFPNATFLPCDSATLDAVVRAFEVVVDALEAFSPIVEPAPREAIGDGRAIAYLDVAGLAPLYGPDARLAARLAGAASAAAESLLSGGGQAQDLARQPREDTHHCSARVGVAASKFVAWVAASLAQQFESDERTMVVPPGEEATFLAPLPLETLPLLLRDRQALQRLGVRTLGEFARLPANAVQHRYGRVAKPGAPGSGSHAWRLAQGVDDAPLRPRPPRPAARVELTFDWEETELDRLVFALKLLADQLAARLASVAAHLTDAEQAQEYAPGDDQQPPEDESFAQPWPDEELHPDGRKEAAIAPLPLRSDAKPQDKKGALADGRGPSALVVDALRLTWRLEGGEERETLLRLAEPAATSAAFMEHLRWHAEGLDRFLAPTLIANCEKQSSFAQNEFPPPDQEERAPELTYQPVEQRIAVRGIALEAVGIQVPGGTQLKLLASPLQLASAAGADAARLDPVQRAQHARRAIARLQARWEGTATTPNGEPPVWQATLVASRLPERAFSRVQPQIGLQVGEGGEQPGVWFDRVAPLSTHPPFWLVDPPAPVLVLHPRRKGGRPILSFGAGRGRSRREQRIVHRGGPWKLVDPTWLTSGEPLGREYYQVETDDGRAYLIFREPTSGAWFLQGVFD